MGQRGGSSPPHKPPSVPVCLCSALIQRLCQTSSVAPALLLGNPQKRRRPRPSAPLPVRFGAVLAPPPFASIATGAQGSSRAGVARPCAPVLWRVPPSAALFSGRGPSGGRWGFVSLAARRLRCVVLFRRVLAGVIPPPPPVPLPSGAGERRGNARCGGLSPASRGAALRPLFVHANLFPRQLPGIRQNWNKTVILFNRVPRLNGLPPSLPLGLRSKKPCHLADSCGFFSLGLCCRKVQQNVAFCSILPPMTLFFAAADVPFLPESPFSESSAAAGCSTARGASKIQALIPRAESAGY